MKNRLYAALVIFCATISAFFVLANGEVLLYWYIGTFTYRRIGWGQRFWIPESQLWFGIASLMAIASILVARRIERVWYGLIIRCIAWMAVTWWLGWLLAFCFGWLAVYPIYRNHPPP